MRHFLDLVYATRSPRQRADVYLPSTAGDPFPVIVFVHGGGYVGGDKSALIPGLVSAATRRGFAVVSIGYRLLQDADPPAQIHDVKAAIRWVRASAGVFGLNPESIAVWGTSAGGQLAALAGTSEGVEMLADDSLGHADEPTRVAAVVDWYGPADFVALRDYLEAERLRAGGPVTFPLDYITQRIDDSPDLVRAMDPATHADPGDPPILIQHGDADAVVPVSQSVVLAERLAAQMGSDRVTLEIERGEGHGAGVFLSTDSIAHVLDWIEDTLGD